MTCFPRVVVVMVVESVVMMGLDESFIREGMLFQSISALAFKVRWTFVTCRSIVVCSCGDLDFFCVVSWMCLLRCCLRLRCLMVDV